jgi:phosphohistidine swiveling domain-containing protein/DNA-binding Xre family transcriptional regulator
MILCKLESIAKKRGKTVTQIAKETGLNRNTITALFHNKIDGIKFDTLEMLCRTYGLGLGDLLEYHAAPAADRAVSSAKWYRQEAEVVPFTCWPWFMAFHLTPTPDIREACKEVQLYIKQNRAFLYWQQPAFNRYAEEVYRIYQDPKKRKQLYAEYLVQAEKIERLYRETRPEALLKADAETTKVWYNQVWDIYQAFWRTSLFIDCFDAGVDQRLIREITEKYKWSADEVSILTTSEQATFHQERLLVLVGIANRWAQHREAGSARALRAFIQTDPEVKAYREAFGYAHSTYMTIGSITEDEVCEDIRRRVADKRGLEKEYVALRTYSAERRKQTDKVLRRHHLEQNPLAFFQDLTFWREHRKKINMMGFHLLDAVLGWLEQKSGIARSYLGYLCFDEFDAVLKGSITQDTLRRRREFGILIIGDGKNYRIIEGDQATSVRNQLEEECGFSAAPSVLSGQVASQGYAQGRARIILAVADFSTFQDSEVLVTGMTRPEFLPLMKRASAIVTNEGGITCHAAIVSRELGIPCVIGTKNATEAIKNGDIVEVRATHGTVRVLRA